MPIMDLRIQTRELPSLINEYLSKKYNYENGHYIDKKNTRSATLPKAIHKQQSQSTPIIDPNTNTQAATWSEQCRSYMVTREITARLRRISFETRGEDRPRSKRTIETPRIYKKE